MEQTLERKLAAIVFIDVADFTALSGSDEQKALSLLDELKSRISPLVKGFNGMLHKELGDGFLYSFNTVTESVRCAIQIQKSIQDIKDLNLRIGIHEGEVTVKGDDILGDDVNIASRLVGSSPIGGIAISGKVQQNISSLKEFKTAHIASPQFKGVDKNIEVHCITSHNLPKGKKSDITSKVKEERFPFIKKILFPATGLILTLIGGAFWFIYPFLTMGAGMDVEREYDARIAILYMENISTEKNSYFADGLTEELINRLSRIQNIKVKPRTDVAVYKNNPAAINQIAEDLNVDYIVEGSVRIINENLRVNAKLISVLDDQTIWSDSYNNTLEDIFNVQDDIAQEIVSQLDKNINISDADISATQLSSTRNMEAYRLVQQASETILNYRISGGNKFNIVSPLLEKTIALDSTYADAYALLAAAKLTRHEDEDADDYLEREEQEFNEAILLIEKALLHDPNHELAKGLSIILPLQKEFILGSKGNYNLLTMRRAAIQMDSFIAQFPDSPFALSLNAFYYLQSYLMLDNESNFDIGAQKLLKSHEILKKSIFKVNDPLQSFANHLNFMYLPMVVQKMEEEGLIKVHEFIIENKQMVCLDGTYSCLDAGRLTRWQQLFYSQFEYEEAMELIEISINRTQEELELEEEDISAKEINYYRYGMINMKWGEYDKAIDGFINAIDIRSKYSDKDDEAIQWGVHYKKFLGMTYYLKGDYKKASEYYYKSYTKLSDLIAKSYENKLDWLELDRSKSICAHGYLELLLGNHESAKNSIRECRQWLDSNSEQIDDDADAYQTYWWLYLYYTHLNDKKNVEKFLDLAYKTVENKIYGIDKYTAIDGKTEIDRFHLSPNRDTEPKYFYCRDIIKTYDNLLSP